ncbi:acetyl-CoA carboxylase biotin carboxyl carrier protein [Bacillus thermophilus]|uniref:Acetyl-CoA carboxylase biotin carboxyl carrier protein n=2 Tax=Siminovitchia TaxID=2837510 RepID=A0ABS2R2W1_9BACI|nr:biotin/lipoyl-binding carrier protein [Siminovitchia thermophila]MBM7713494.1 acetyl-CoA carboxylase biotin carboxyl carrier protein [Siminovitchia thermophila]
MKAYAPMGGTVWKIQVGEGDLVNKGDALIILESMKMEIPVEAPLDGKVSKINVQEGDFVQENDVVVEME